MKKMGQVFQDFWYLKRKVFQETQISYFHQLLLPTPNQTFLQITVPNVFQLNSKRNTTALTHGIHIFLQLHLSPPISNILSQASVMQHFPYFFCLSGNFSLFSFFTFPLLKTFHVGIPQASVLVFNFFLSITLSFLEFVFSTLMAVKTTCMFLISK